VGVLHRRAGIEDCHAGRVEARAIGALEPVEFRVEPAPERPPVELARGHVPAIGARLAEGVGEGRCEDHQLLRYAAADDAGPAHAVFLGQRDFRAMLARRDPRRAHPARAAADDEEIVVEGHPSPLLPVPLPARPCRLSGRDR